MSTDAAFALGVVGLLTPRSATRLRVFLLTLAIVDDLAALVVIAIVYTSHISVVALVVAVALFGVFLALRYAPFGRRVVSIAVAVGLWVAMFKSGIDPVISGVAIGLAHNAFPPGREELERTTAADQVAARATDARAGPFGAAERAVVDLPQRASAVRPAPVDELCDRAAVRACQRGDPPHREAAGRRGHVADHARDPDRLRARQAGGHLRRLVARVAAGPARPPATGRAGRCWSRRRVAGIGFTVSLLIFKPRVHRRAARSSQARRNRNGDRRPVDRTGG